MVWQVWVRPVDRWVLGRREGLRAGAWVLDSTFRTEEEATEQARRLRQFGEQAMVHSVDQ